MSSLMDSLIAEAFIESKESWIAARTDGRLQPQTLNRMSLTDALLLDPHPLDVWIAYRTDGVKGSGTLNDPWNGNGAANFDQVMRDLPIIESLAAGVPVVATDYSACPELVRGLGGR